MVSVVHVSERDARPAEKVIKRRTEWGEKLDLGVIPREGRASFCSKMAASAALALRRL